MRTPISIITGYLGAGKTTLLKNILNKADKKIAVIMNEFGEIDIDSKIIKGKNINIVELAGGCVCCSLTGEFELATKEIIKKYKPDIIVVETTGLAEPDTLIFDIENELPDLKLDSIIALVDSDAFFKFPLGKTGKIQVEMADIIILNKVDLINKKEINHEHTKNIEFFSFKSNKIFDKEKFEEFIRNLSKEIYRAKGFINLDKKFYLFNFVAQKYSLEEFKADKTELVFIGENVNKIKEKILKQLSAL